MLNIAIIGTGGQGITNIKNLMQQPDARIIAISDVNEESDYSRFYYGGVAGSRPALKLIDKHYTRRSAAYEGCRLHVDFRKMFEKEKHIDAVLVATPDHVHSAAAMAAIKNGKHVYCEKPLAHSIYEVRQLAKAAKAAKVATQMGNQGHAGEGLRLTAEWIHDGAIGPVRQVQSWTGVGGRGWTKLDRRPTDTPPVPNGLNWDLWLGPVQHRPYHIEYAPYNWRGWWDFGTGAIGDMACHNMDPAIWVLDLAMPTSVEPSSTRRNDQTTPTASIVRYKFDARGDQPPVNVTWYDGGLMPPRPEDLEAGRRMGSNGILFIGDKGKILCGGWAGIPRIIPETKMKAYKRPAKTLKRTKGPHRDWLNAIKNNTKACADFEYSAHLTEIVLLGVLALRTGKTIYWDGAAMKAKGFPEADPFIKPEFRTGWSL